MRVELLARIGTEAYNVLVNHDAVLARWAAVMSAAEGDPKLADAYRRSATSDPLPTLWSTKPAASSKLVHQFTRRSIRELVAQPDQEPIEPSVAGEHVDRAIVQHRGTVQDDGSVQARAVANVVDARGIAVGAGPFVEDGLQRGVVNSSRFLPRTPTASNSASVASCPVPATADTTGVWARQDSNL